MGGVWCEAVAGSQSREKSERIRRTLRRSKVHNSSTDDKMSKPFVFRRGIYNVSG